MEPPPLDVTRSQSERRPMGNDRAPPRPDRYQREQGEAGGPRWLEEHRHEGSDVAEAHPLVGPPGRQVEVVDVEGDRRGEAAQALLDDGCHAPDREALAAQL